MTKKELIKDLKETIKNLKADNKEMGFSAYYEHEKAFNNGYIEALTNVIEKIKTMGV